MLAQLVLLVPVSPAFASWYHHTRRRAVHCDLTGQPGTHALCCYTVPHPCRAWKKVMRTTLLTTRHAHMQTHVSSNASECGAKSRRLHLHFALTAGHNEHLSGGQWVGVMHLMQCMWHWQPKDVEKQRKQRWIARHPLVRVNE